MKLLITGGAGYIGSHTLRICQNLNFDVTVLDNFSTGHKSFVKDCEILEVDLLDKTKLSKKLKNRKFDGVIHFAAKSLVEESVRKPEIYYQNNVVGTLNLLDEMLQNNIENLVFSSTAAIFGNPIENKITESHPKKPINPYGKTKLIIEELLKDFSFSHNMNVTSFRYFNAAGAANSGDIWELRDPETHLIPNILNSVAKKTNNLKVYGNNYLTHDGTCIRDYLHVDDIAEAHILGLKKMLNKKGFYEFNLGNGRGFSVLEIIKGCEKVLKRNIPYEVVERRAGDPDILVADSKKVKNDLNWKPLHTDIFEIIETAWKWHSRQ